ncbi:AraC family transcriptional regulator [Luteimonas aquatica]|uniref:AraC family transcriptional regulator n=1 Tax=Luteimonas aquatica TaxID=450364 RepID=UPI001F593BC7|nr:AraC family transcriptional regulator [Luteimonas aquatica]
MELADFPSGFAAPAAAANPRTETLAAWPGVELSLLSERILAPADWAIHGRAHTLIVHFEGRMQGLVTEIEGQGARRAEPSGGDVLLIPAGRRYASQARGGRFQCAELRIAPEHFEALTDRAGGFRDLPARLMHRDEFLHLAVRRLAEQARRDDDLSRMMGAALSQVIGLHLLERYGEDGAKAGAAADPARLSMQARYWLEDYIEANLSRRITLDALAELAGMSVHRLLVAFRAAFGTTPAQYVIRRRLARAKALLAETRQDITTIAVATGFASHSHFTTAFKAHEGVTPNAFRRARR